MPETLHREYEYPPGKGVRPDVPYWLQVALEKVDADMALALAPKPHVMMRAAAQSADVPASVSSRVAAVQVTDEIGDQSHWTLDINPASPYYASVLIETDGIYQIVGNVTMTVAGFSAHIWNEATQETLAQSSQGSGASLTANVAATRRITAGQRLMLRVFRTDAGARITKEASITPTHWTITRLSGITTPDPVV